MTTHTRWEGARKAGLLLGGMVLLTAPLAAQGSSPFGPTDYSATMVIQLPTGGRQRMEIAKRGMAWRTTLAMGGRGGSMYTLMLLDKKVMYMVMPQGMCMQRGLGDLPPGAMLDEAAKQHAQVTDVGPETVTIAGKSYATEHRRVQATDAQGQSRVMEVWTANDLQNFPVKEVMAGKGGTTTVEYEDIDLTAPAAALFAPPAHCGGMPGMPGRGR
ncbi:MAG TPA: hypothetical protein VMV31_11810 [Terriglobales bacterium]|nr:hypothetical protein [Terriglobales bacterium]